MLDENLSDANEGGEGVILEEQLVSEESADASMDEGVAESRETAQTPRDGNSQGRTRMLTNSDDCVICGSPLNIPGERLEYSTLICGHAYHKSCVVEPCRFSTDGGFSTAMFCSHEDCRKKSSAPMSITDHYESAVRDYLQKRYSSSREALEKIMEEVGSDDPGAMHAYELFASMYKEGDGVEKNRAQALKLWEKAEKVGSTRALLELGLLHRDFSTDVADEDDFREERRWTHGGGHVRKDDFREDRRQVHRQKARSYFEKAAGISNAAQEGPRTCRRALEELGELLLNTTPRGAEAVEQDVELAKGYLVQASQEGSMQATVRLGFWYRDHGNDGDDWSRALLYFQKADEMTDSREPHLLGLRLQGRFGEWARQRLEMEANSSNSRAAFSLAWVYRIGVGVTKDIDKAVRYFKLASKEGNAKAAVQLGMMYSRGYEVEEDKYEALKYLKNADEKNEPVAATELGLIYKDENGCEAQRYFRKACKAGDKEAMYELGMMYTPDEGEDRTKEGKSTKLARWYLRKASDAKSRSAALELSSLLICPPDGEAPDEAAGFRCLDSAREMGFYPLGLAFLEGTFNEYGSSEKSIDVAFWCFHEAVNVEENPLAAAKLGEMYMDIDRHKALKYLVKAFDDEELDENIKNETASKLASMTHECEDHPLTEYLQKTKEAVEYLNESESTDKGMSETQHSVQDSFSVETLKAELPTVVGKRASDHASLIRPIIHLLEIKRIPKVVQAELLRDESLHPCRRELEKAGCPHRKNGAPWIYRRTHREAGSKHKIANMEDDDDPRILNPNVLGWDQPDEINRSDQACIFVTPAETYEAVLDELRTGRTGEGVPYRQELRSRHIIVDDNQLPFVEKIIGRIAQDRRDNPHGGTQACTGIKENKRRRITLQDGGQIQGTVVPVVMRGFVSVPVKSSLPSVPSRKANSCPVRSAASVSSA